jgi:hypothetical protein
MLIELCVGNYATSNNLVNEIYDIHKISSSYHNKLIIWMSFSNPIIRMLIKKIIYSLLYKQYLTRLDTNWTLLELAKKSIPYYNKNLNFQFN